MNYYYIYILESYKDGQWYTGYTDDLKQRVKKHNQGQNKSTKHKRPWKLIYFEGCINKEDALAREKYLKSGMGKRYLKNRMKRYLHGNDF
jgi:putative endonuclease